MKERRYREFIVTVHDKRTGASVELRLREYTVADAKMAARRAGWHDGILGVREAHPSCPRARRARA